MLVYRLVGIPSRFLLVLERGDMVGILSGTVYPSNKNIVWEGVVTC